MLMPLNSGGYSHWQQFSGVALIDENGGSIRQPLHRGDMWKTLFSSSPILSCSFQVVPPNHNPFISQNSVVIWWVDVVKRGILSPLRIENNFHCSCLKGYLFTGGTTSSNEFIVKICSLILVFFDLLRHSSFFCSVSSMDTTKNECFFFWKNYGKTKWELLVLTWKTILLSSKSSQIRIEK